MSIQALALHDRNRWQAVATKAQKKLETRLFIDGKFVDAKRGGRFTTVNPATGAPIAEVSDVKADVEALLHPRTAIFEPSAHPAFRPGQCARVVLQGKPAGFLGALHPRWCQKYEIPVNTVCFELNLDQILECQRAAYREVARFPTSRRDVAVVVADLLPVDAILCAAREAAPGYVTEVALFDVYRGKGIDLDKKSLAFRILMQDTRGTLTEADVEAAVSGILKELQEKFDASLRK